MPQGIVCWRRVRCRSVALRARAFSSFSERTLVLFSARRARCYSAVLVIALAAVVGCARDTDSRPASSSEAAEAGPSASSSPGIEVAAVDTSTRDDFGEPLPADARYAERVVSLNPAFTEISFAIGAGGLFVGRTSWDDRPPEARAVTDVGAGIRPNVEAVLATRPTLVLLYATAENRAAADAFKRAGVHTLALRTITISDFQRAARVLGVALGKETAATQLVDSINTTLAAVRAAVAGAPRPRVVWPSWEAPVLVVANASYEAELLEIAGAQNVFADRNESVAGVTIEEIARRDPELVLAGPQRVSQLRQREPWQAIRAVREGRFITLDSMVVGRPGVTIGMAAVSIARALHPDRANRLP